MFEPSRRVSPGEAVPAAETNRRKVLLPLTHCEDCAAELHGKYCSRCGQVAVDYRRSFRYIIADAADSFLNWDSKFFGTFGLLLLRPGWLTNQFIGGRRTRYLHPLRLYLLVSIVFFLCARLIPVQIGKPKTIENLTPEERAKVEAVMKNVPNLSPTVRDEVSRALVKPAETPMRDSGKIAPAPTGNPEKKIHPEASSGDGGRADSFRNWMRQRAESKVGKNGINAQFFLETLRGNISTMMLFCIPLFAFVLKILYLRQRRFYIEHFVYALHIHSFFYMAVLLTVFVALAAERWAPSLVAPLIWIFSIATFVQVFLSIRQVYRQSWFMTAFKFALGGIIYYIVLALAFVATAFATILLP